MDVVDPVDAWARWASGDPALRDAFMFGLKILWWARIGKLMAFIAGLILVVDIIGPKRILAFLNRRAADRQRRLDETVERVRQRANYKEEFSAQHISSIRFALSQGYLAATLGSIALVIVIANHHPAISTFETVIICVLLALGFISFAYGIAIMRWLYTRERAIRIARVTSLGVFALGFTLDMLGS